MTRANKSALVFSLFLMSNIFLPAHCGQSNEEPSGEKNLSRTAPESSETKQGYASFDRELQVQTQTTDLDEDRLKLEAIIRKSAGGAWERLFRLGKESYDHSKYVDAQKYFLQAVQELKKTNIKDERLISSRNSLGEAYLAEGQYSDAATAFELALQTEKELGLLTSPEGGRTLAGLGVIYKDTGKFDKAEKLTKDALRTQELTAGAVSIGVADCLIDLAELYRIQKLYNEAEASYKLALETLSKCKDVPELKLAGAVEKTAVMFHEQGKLAEANRLFAVALDIKDKHSSFYTITDPRDLGLVYYRCLSGSPNSFHVFTRGIEAEFINVKDVSVVSTLTAQIFSRDWYLLKAQVTVHNGGKKPVTAMHMPPTLKLESPKVRRFVPLSSEAIAAELESRGQVAFSRILHSADFDYIADSLVTAGAVVPLPGLGFLGGFPALAHLSPNWQARIDARNSAMRFMANTRAAESTIVAFKPAETTIAPGESETFIIFFPYCKFDKCTLKILLGNSVIEFPFTAHSG